MQPFGYGPYQPPATTAGRPAVIAWYRVYALVVALSFLGFAVFWETLKVRGGAIPPPAAVMWVVRAAVYGGGGFYVLAACVPYRPWGWTLGLVAITLGLFSAGAIVALPLLIFWVKPLTKAAFGRL